MSTASPGRLRSQTQATNVTVKLDAAYRARIAAVASYKKRTAHYIMKDAIEKYLLAEEAEQAMLAIVDESTAHFDATGLHIDLDEFKAWVEAVRVNRDAPLPICHV
jgi:predicted transcriptional regulator